MTVEKTWDIIPDTTGGYRLMAFGSLEHTFRLGMVDREDIRLVRIKPKGITLRYSVPVGILEADRKKTIEEVEAWIAKAYMG